MRKLIIGFSTVKGFKIGSELIKLYQGFTCYSHVYVRLFDEEVKKWIVYEASYGDLHSIEFENLKEDNKICEEFEFDITEEQYIKIKDFCIQSLQKKYGFMTIVGILTKSLFGIKLGNDGDKTYICSEFGTRILEIVGLLRYSMLAKTPDYMTPLDLYNITKHLN